MKPEAVPKTFVCSACGLDWKRHGEKPTLAKCVELLKADLAKRAVVKEGTKGIEFKGTGGTWLTS